MIPRRSARVFRIRSRNGFIHLALGRSGPALCGARLADGKYTTHGAVACRECIDIRDGLPKFWDGEGAGEPRKHAVTNSYRAAMRGKRYLAHWVIAPPKKWWGELRWKKHLNDRLTYGRKIEEHRLYVSRNRVPPNYDDCDPEDPATFGTSYFCPSCKMLGERLGPDKLPLEGVELPVEAPKIWPGTWWEDTYKSGFIPANDPTIHETSRNLPRENSRERMKRFDDFVRAAGLVQVGVESADSPH